MPPPTRTEGEPHDHLTRLADQMIDHLHTLPGGKGVRAIVMLDGDESGGIGLDGWDDDASAVAHMLLVLGRIMEASGKRMDVIMLGEDGVMLADDDG